MRDNYRPSFVCSDCRLSVYGSVRAVPRRLLCDECLAVSHTLLCAECLWIRILMPNPAERAEMRADEVLTRVAFAALAASRSHAFYPRRQGNHDLGGQSGLKVGRLR
jgi:hypothetical protein